MRLFVFMFGVVWISLWTTGTLHFDAMWARRVKAQEEARSFTTTPGQVVASTVESTRGDEPSYRPLIHFRYEFAGTKREASTYSFREINTSDAAYARALVADHPPGRAVTVYVDPADPSRALLAPGITGLDLLLALFLVPFNLVMLGSWIFAIQALTDGRPRVAGGAPVLETPHRVRVRLTPVEPWAAAALALGGLSMLAMFCTAFTLGMHPSLGAMTLVVSGVTLGAFGVYHRARCREEEGAYDVVLDRGAGTLTLPAVLGHASPAVERLSNVRGAQSVRTESKDSDGDTVVRWRVCVMLGSPGQERERAVAEWTSELPAAELADWLQERLKKR